MITEPTQIASFRSVDKFALVERHEVEVLDPFLVILLHAPPEDIFANNLANIFKYKVIRSQIGVSAESVAFLDGFDDGDVGVLLLLETLILAASPAPAIPDTLHFGRTVDTVGVLATGLIRL